MALEWVFLDHFSVDVEGSILESELQYIDISCTLLEHGSANVSCGRPNNTLGGGAVCSCYLFKLQPPSLPL